MYSRLIVDQKLREVAKRGRPFERASLDKSLSMKERFLKLVGADGKFSRDLSPTEREFTRSELTICKFDFRYWAERYGTIKRDAQFGAGVGPIEFWESQQRALELIGNREEEIYREYEKYSFTDGVLAAWHKSRQLGATAMMRLI